jgi:hypothetical protein
MIHVDRDHYRLSTGRVIYANGGIIGLAPEGNARDTREWRDGVSEGYDGGIMTGTDPDDYDDEGPWTDAERAELAAYMVELWRQWGRLPQ